MKQPNPTSPFFIYTHKNGSHIKFMLKITAWFGSISKIDQKTLTYYYGVMFQTHCQKWEMGSTFRQVFYSCSFIVLSLVEFWKFWQVGGNFFKSFCCKLYAEYFIVFCIVNLILYWKVSCELLIFTSFKVVNWLLRCFC